MEKVKKVHVCSAFILFDMTMHANSTLMYLYRSRSFGDLGQSYSVSCLSTSSKVLSKFHMQPPGKGAKGERMFVYSVQDT